MSSWSATVTRKNVMFWSKLSAPASVEGSVRKPPTENAATSVTAVAVEIETKFVSYPDSWASAKPGSFRTYWYFDCSEASQQSFRSPNAWRVRPPFAKPFNTSCMTMVCAKWMQECSRVWPATQKSGSSLIKRPLVIHATSDTTSGWSSSRLHLTKRSSNISRRTVAQGSFSFQCRPGKSLSRAGELPCATIATAWKMTFFQYAQAAGP
jgi:hypothetical protein